MKIQPNAVSQSGAGLMYMACLLTRDVCRFFMQISPNQLKGWLKVQFHLRQLSVKVTVMCCCHLMTDWKVQ